MILRKDINGLRGLSFLFIYLYHSFNNIFKCGFIAVDIFILISGYFSISSKRLLKIHIYLTNRIKRLIPVGYFVLLICYILSSLYIKKSKLEIIYNDLYSSILGYSNIYFYKKTINYFGDSLDLSINLHYWYFCLQEQYYVLFALLIFNTNKNIQYIMEIFFFIFSIIYSFLFYKTYFNCVYYLINARLWEFIFGIFVHISNLTLLNSYYSNISTFLYIYLATYPNPKSLYIPFPSNIILLLIVSIILISKANSILSSYTYQIMGNISFSAYLIHYPILFICKSVNFNNSLGIFISVITISYFLHIIIENNSIIRNLYCKEITFYFIILEVCLIIFLKIEINKLSYSNKYLTRTKALDDWRKIDKLFTLYVERKYVNVLLFMGDSHIMQWIPVLLKNKNIKYYNLIYFHYWIKYIIYSSNKYMINIISKMKIKYIVMSNYLANCTVCIIKQYNDLYLPFKIFIETVVKYVDNKIYIIQDIPYQFKDVFINPNDHISYTYSILGVNCSSNIFPIFKCKKLVYINTIKWICKNNKCGLLKDSYSVYIGNNHLTISFTLSLQNELNKEITFDKLNKTINISTILLKNF